MTLTRASNISLSARLHRGTARQNGLISSIVCLYARWMKPANGAEIIARSTLLPKHPGKWGAWSLPTEPSVMKNQHNKAVLTGLSAAPREMGYVEHVVLWAKLLIVCSCSDPHIWESCPLIHPQTSLYQNLPSCTLLKLLQMHTAWTACYIELYSNVRNHKYQIIGLYYENVVQRLCCYSRNREQL